MKEPIEKQEWLDYLHAKLTDAQTRESQTVDPVKRAGVRREVEDLAVKIWVMNLDVHKWAQSQNIHLH